MSTASNARKRRRGARGQVTLFVVLMIMTFLWFFQFVINVGLLVNAKINLQNAADMAAYAGAAVQARQLTDISFLNYEMRRQYKKFLYRYYVIGNMAQKGFPGQGSGIREWKADPADREAYGVPAVCVIFNPNDNYCQIRTTESIRITPANPLDAISVALNKQLKALETIRVRNCYNIKDTNKTVLATWLYNTDPYLTDLDRQLQRLEGNRSTPTEAYKRRVMEVTKALSFGMGLVPRMFLLDKRIDTLNYYVNYPPQKDLTFSRVSELQTTGDVAAHERPIQAYLSALNTLGGAAQGESAGDHTFDDVGSIRIDELIPGSEDGARALGLVKVKADLDTYYIDYPNVTDSDTGAEETRKDCEGQPALMKVTQLPLGVHKDPKVLTYYAIRLTAKAKLLYSPFGPVTLTAYAAAQPFGSRIGPPVEADDFRNPGAKAAGRLDQSQAAAAGNVQDFVGVPNLRITADDEISKGWNEKDYLRAVFAPLLQNGSTVSRSVDWPDMERAYHHAMAPTEWEKGKYNIVTDLGANPADPYHENSGDPFVHYFDGTNRHAVWAPIMSVEKTDDAIQDLSAEIERSYPGTPQLKRIFADLIVSYVNNLKSASPSDQLLNETFSVIYLQDPFTFQGPGQPPVSVNVPNFTLTEAEDVKTSWAGVKHGAYQDRRRVGYSVKLVAFQTLREKRVGSTPDAGSAWENDIPSDGDAFKDILKLQH